MRLTIPEEMRALLKIKIIGDKMVKASGVASDGKFWVAKVLETIEDLEKDSKHVSLLSDIDSDDQMLRTKAREVGNNLRMVQLIGYVE